MAVTTIMVPFFSILFNPASLKGTSPGNPPAIPYAKILRLLPGSFITGMGTHGTQVFQALP